MHRHLQALWMMALVLLAGCATSPPPADVVDGKPALRVGVTPNCAPIIFKSGGKVTGLEADMALMVGKRLDRPVTFVALPWASMIDALNEGRIDVIMSGMSITPGRSAQVQFTRPYLASGQMVLARSAERARRTSLRVFPMSNERIGVEKGSTGDIFVQQRCTLATRVTFRSIDDMVKALLNGKIDLALHDAPAILHQAVVHESNGLVPIPGAVTQESLAWAVRKSNTELANQLNTALVGMGNDGSLEALCEHWIPLYNAYWRD